MSSAAQHWWEYAPSEFPNAFGDDRRAAEATRLQALISGVGVYDVNGLWLRLRRAATLLELATLNKPNDEGHKRTWEIIALIQESIGVIDQSKRDYQWLLSALAWQLADAPSIAGLLASKLISERNFLTRDIFERLAIAFSLRNFDSLRGLAESAIDEGIRLRTQVEESKDWTAAIEAGMLLSIGSVMRDVAKHVSYYSEQPPNLDGIDYFTTLAESSTNSRRYRVGRLLAACVRRFMQSSSRILVDGLPSLTEDAKERIHNYLWTYPELWPSQRNAISQGLLNPSQRHFVVAVPTSSGKTLCGELAMIQALTDNPLGVCFYVVPTRALVEEKSRELM